MSEQKQMTPTQGLIVTTEKAISQIEEMSANGRLVLPPNYSASNAVKQAQLAIQDNPKLMACSMASLGKSMIDLAILGLNISKEQAYFIPYGNQCKLSVSYQGKKAIAKRIDPQIKDIIARPVKQSEVFEFEDLDNGYSRIIKHQRTMESMNSKEYLGGYATIIYENGETKSLIMTYDRIKKSWSMSQTKPIDDKGNLKETSTHAKFTDEMINKTLITAISKPIINSSDDSDLYCQTAQAISLDEKQMTAEQQIEENANNGEVIDIEGYEVEDLEIDVDTGEILE